MPEDARNAADENTNTPDKPAYVVYTSSGACLIGLSDGPSGTLIVLEKPLRYNEVVKKTKEGPMVEFLTTRMLHTMRFERVTVRWESVAGPSDMPANVQTRLCNTILDSYQRFAMQEAGIVPAGGGGQLPPDVMAKIKEGVERRLREGGLPR